jgi:hypothetical protein
MINEENERCRNIAECGKRAVFGRKGDSSMIERTIQTVSLPELYAICEWRMREPGEGCHIQRCA